MATQLDFILNICEKIKETGDIRYRKMFGEYMIYVNNKPILLVCDNTVYVKILDCLTPYIHSASKGLPYKGAKEHYILEFDDMEQAQKIISILEEVTPLPKPRKK
ncbi:MAG: TfoX/Sxy family protein [Clostridiales bacterium]|nr:TfoX/Sxy family protein [Clostridiales bacterium]